MILMIILGPVQTSKFTFAQPNVHEEKLLFLLIGIWFGTCKVRRLNRAWHSKWNEIQVNHPICTKTSTSYSLHRVIQLQPNRFKLLSADLVLQTTVRHKVQQWLPSHSISNSDGTEWVQFGLVFWHAYENTICLIMSVIKDRIRWNEVLFPVKLFISIANIRETN